MTNWKYISEPYWVDDETVRIDCEGQNLVAGVDYYCEGFIESGCDIPLHSSGVKITSTNPIGYVTFRRLVQSYGCVLPVDAIIKLYDSDENIYVDEETRTIPEPPICTEGEQRCLGQDLQECINNEWVTIEQNSAACGFVCDEGVHEVLEYCPDNVTEKRWRDCINNQWVEGTQECPCECTEWQNAECINETQRRQVRTCMPTGCDIEEQPVYDPSCGVVPPPPRVEEKTWWQKYGAIVTGAGIAVVGTATFIYSKIKGKK